MPKVVKSSCREMILKIKEFCEAEQRNNGLLIPLNNVRKRVAAMTGVSEKTVTRITQEGKIAASTSKKIVIPGKSRPHPKKINLDSFDLCVIRHKIHEFYAVKKELPTLNKLLAVLKQDIEYKAEKNVDQDPKKIVKLTEDAFSSVTPEDWFAQCKHVEHVEDEYFRNDGLIDEEIDRFIISTSSDSETDSDHDSDIHVDSSDSDCSMAGINPIDDHNYTVKI